MTRAHPLGFCGFQGSPIGGRPARMSSSSNDNVEGLR